MESDGGNLAFENNFFSKLIELKENPRSMWYLEHKRYCSKKIHS